MKKITFTYLPKYWKPLAGVFFVVATTFSALYYFNVFHWRYSNMRVNLSTEEIEDRIKVISEECLNLEGEKKQDCYKSQLISLTKQYGITTSEKILFTLQERDDTLRSCHVIAHYMSREAYERDPRGLFKLLDTLDINSCGGGLMHGALEAYLAKEKKDGLTTAVVEDICGRSTNERRQTTCAHLMGHMALINTYGNVDEALPLCESLRYQWHYMCYDGLFMEDHQKLALSEHGIMPMPAQNKEYIDKMESDCAKYEGIPLKTCWKEMAEMYAHIYGYDPYRVWKECSKAPANELVNECYLKGAELLAMYPYYFDNAEKVTSICSFYSNSWQYTDCTRRILSAMIYNSTRFITRGITLCQNIPINYINSCFYSLQQILQSVVPDPVKRKELCTRLPEIQRDGCY